MSRKKKSGTNWFVILNLIWIGFLLFHLGQQFPTDIQKRLAYLDGWKQAFNYDWHYEYVHGLSRHDPTPVPTPDYLTSNYRNLTSASDR